MPISSHPSKPARVLLTLSLTALLAACATPSAPVSKTVYDFGAPTVQATESPADLPPLALAEIQTAWGQSSTAMQYRLAYANPQELRPYALAHWSMPPAQLVAQRVRTVLSQQRPVVSLGDSTTAFVLHIALEQFGQTFESPKASTGTVQLRATLLKGDQLVAQRDFVAVRPAPSNDAAGGARALSEATHATANELAAWLTERML